MASEEAPALNELPDEVPKELTEEAPKECSEEAPKELSEAALQKCSEQLPKICAEEPPKECSEEAPKERSEVAPQNCSEELPKTCAEEAPQVRPEATPQACSQGAPEVRSEVAPKDRSSEERRRRRHSRRSWKWNPNGGLTLTDLSTDLLYIIFELVSNTYHLRRSISAEAYEESCKLVIEHAPRASLHSLSKVNRALHQCLRTFMFREITISICASEERKSQEFIEFLWDHEEVRASVQKINIPLAPFAPLSELVQAGLAVLITSLPRLRAVRFGGDVSRNSDRYCLRGLDLSILEAIVSHENDIKVKIDCYVHTFDSLIPLNAISNLEALRVSLVNVPCGEPGFEEADEFFESPSRNVCDILDANQGLREVTLSLPDWRRKGLYHYLWGEESANALERIGPHMPKVNVLGFEGQFRFPQRAWTIWSESFDWSRLKTLSIAYNAEMIGLMCLRLRDELPNLRTLKLDAYDGPPPPPAVPETLPGDLESVPAFLASLNLQNISLSGFPREMFVNYVAAAGQNLERIRFHIRPIAYDGPKRAALETRNESIFTAEQLEQVRVACPRLVQLGIDVHDAPAEPSKAVADWIYEALPRFESVEHLRLLTPGDCFDRAAHVLPGAVMLFRSLRAHKRGRALKSLVVCRVEEGIGGLCEVWDFSNNVVVAEQKFCQTLSREVYHIKNEPGVVSDLKLHRRSQFLMKRADWRMDPTFGFPEGF